MFHRVNSNVNIGHIYGFCVRICGGTTETWDAKNEVFHRKCNTVFLHVVFNYYLETLMLVSV